APAKPAPAVKKEAAVEKKAVVQAPASSETMRQPVFSPEPPLENYEFPFPTGSAQERIAASPFAKKILKKKGIDLSSIKGSGPGGRVTSKDLDLGMPDQMVSFGKREIPHILPGTYEEVALTPMRKVIAQRLQQAKSFIPHIYVRQDIDAEPLF